MEREMKNWQGKSMGVLRSFRLQQLNQPKNLFARREYFLSCRETFFALKETSFAYRERFKREA